MCSGKSSKQEHFNANNNHRCAHEDVCESDHCWAAGEGQQPVDQSLQLLDEDLGRVDEDGLQAGQSGELDALVGTRQGLQQQRQELETHGGTSRYCCDQRGLCLLLVLWRRTDRWELRNLDLLGQLVDDVGQGLKVVGLLL